MKVAATIALAALAAAAPPSATVKESPRAVAAECESAVTLDASTNIWKTHKLHANNFYRSEIEEAVTTMSDESLKEKALKVADIGTFVWV
jgi:cellulose 1,4-beta-cellobiosidase